MCKYRKKYSVDKRLSTKINNEEPSNKTQIGFEVPSLLSQDYILLYTPVDDCGELAVVVTAKFGPSVVGAVNGLDGQLGLVLVEQDLDQYVIREVARGAHGAIEHHLDIAGLGDGVVVLPVLVQGLEVVTAIVHAVQLHEAR